MSLNINEVLYSLLGVQNVAEMVRCGRLRRFEHVEHNVCTMYVCMYVMDTIFWLSPSIESCN